MRTHPKARKIHPSRIITNRWFFVHNLFPYPEASVYPPPSSHGYQTHLGEENPSYNWAGQPAPSDRGPHLYSYQDDPDCLTFLRGCVATTDCYYDYLLRRVSSLLPLGDSRVLKLNNFACA
ncbi:unnamed protein product [Triticum turgidum subsp. durum]|uniref:Uncharacterized protein n=1 Tax=Triticum turgidum subsp. durum TaxID=4567 RepID=A0A9R1NVT1_TRITD|nr:unnamed protein product [Triticum turgidum subsp. durum]